ncbi:MAG: DUF1697 domain-containing protein [Bacteroidia bacterium]|nr:DUF1697 domain-containing protein [Bacteroidia bacterium]
MKKQIAILRGINVGGKRKILMADLKELFVDLGFEDIQTYIQSGNVMFNSSEKKDNILIADEIEQSIFKEYGFTVPVIVISVNELNKAIAENPFFKKDSIDIDRLHLTFLKEIPENEKLQNIKSYNYSPDKYEIKERNVFIYCSAKYSDSKLTNTFFESKLKVSATTRNWKTVISLSELSKSN